MGKYYALVAGLPTLSVDSQKQPYSQVEFYLELQGALSKKDKTLLDWLWFEEANRILLPLVESGQLLQMDIQDTSLNTLPLDELCAIAREAKMGREAKRITKLPRYMQIFVHEVFYESVEADGDVQNKKNVLSLEDYLAQLYYAEAVSSSNKFLSEWFRLNQTIRNVMAVYTCRRLGWSVDQFVVGDGYIECQLKTSKSKDFDLSEDLPYISQIIQIAEELNITRRERMIDLLKWRWLEEATFVKVFDIDSLLAYYIRLGIIERWLKLDEKQGEQRFRSLVMGLKAESNASLDDFRRSTKR